MTTPRAKCLKAIQLLARLSAADDNGFCECWSCGAVNHYTDCDGGHFIPKGASSFWSLEIENVHPQCKGCNGFGMRYGTASQEYTIKMADVYGQDFVNHMLWKKKHVKKMYKKDYEDLLKEFNELIKLHKNRIG